MKLKNNYMLALLGAGLLMANSANAQWSRNAVTSQTYLTNTGDKVGIGTTNPGFKLDVRGSGIQTMSFKSTDNNASILLDRGSATSTSSVTYRNLGTNVWQTGIISNDNYQIRNNVLASPAITVLSSNNFVGIGTNSPSVRLEVVGNSRVTGNFHVTNNSTFGASMNVSGNVTATGDVNAANVIATGNVGIGTSSPSTKLHVTGGTDASLTGGGYVQIGADGNDNLLFDGNEIVARNGSNASTLFLNSVSGNIRMCGNATSTGKVSIGHGTPESQLHIVHPMGLGVEGLRIEREGEANYWTLYTTDNAYNHDLQLHENGVYKGSFANSNGVYTPVSDRRLKTNIRSVENVLDRVMKLEVKNYELKSDATKRNNLGLIAQDVLPLFPELVYHNVGEGQEFYTMDYSGFGTIAVKAIQEQQKEIDELKQTVKQLDQALAQCCISYGEKSATGLSTDGGKLEQNAPNPFSQSTLIKFYIPQNFKSAQVKVYSSLGEEMKAVEIKTSGVGQVEISGNTMAAGIYQYTLLIDGKAIDSKQMILTK